MHGIYRYVVRLLKGNLSLLFSAPGYMASARYFISSVWYLYEVWVNTEEYPMLDCDKITLDNHEFYKDLLQAILEADKVIDIPFEMIGIGLETDIHYNGNIMDTIENSKDVILWIIKKHIELTNDLKLYKIREGKGIYILEKK